jgi:hypothetical protein
MDKIKVSFIIAHRYYRGYQSFLNYYINNIINFYGDDTNIIIVDNNSSYLDDVTSQLPVSDKITVLINNSECKFELGAYKIGIEYLTTNNLLNKNDYVVFTQDNFVAKNKYDFTILKNNNIKASTIVTWNNDFEYFNIATPILEKLNLNNNLDKIGFCWCSSFILSSDVVKTFYEYVKDIIITDRKGSMSSERYLPRMFFELNGGFNHDIDGVIENLDYYCHDVKVEDAVNNFFCKISQKKTEKTIDVL